MFPLFCKKVGGKKPPTLTYINSATSTSTSATATVGPFTIPRSGLVIAVISNGGDNRTISSATIGGSAASVAAFPSGDITRRGYAWREVSAGSHSVSVTLSGTSGAGSYWHIAVFLLENYSSPTPYATSFPASVTASSISSTMTLTEGSIALYSVMSGPGSVTWSSATQVASSSVFGGSFLTAAKQVASTGSHTEIAYAGSSTYLVITGAAWR